MSMSKSKQASPLTGQALVDKVRQLENHSKEDKAKACGYYTETKNGVKRVNMMKFLNALIDAEGIELDSCSPNGKGKGGRSASYRISVQNNYNLLIGAAYTKQMGLEPGTEFEIILGRKHIKLEQIGFADEED